MFNTIVANNISQAATFLTQGNLVAIPTETVYGLAANATNINAIAKIYAAKNRPTFNPLILHVGHTNAIENYATVDALSQKIINAFMPGPLTILLPKKNTVNHVITAGSNLVAIRIPMHALLLQLLNQLPFAIVAPSANISGYVSPTTAMHVLESFKNIIPFILDGGACSIGLESTIVQVKNAETVTIHRQGAITASQIQAVLPNINIANKVAETIESPGQLKSHYATKTPLIIGNLTTLIPQYYGQNIATLSFKTRFNNVPANRQFVLSPSGNINQAAQHLFIAMRLIDSLGFNAILTETFPNHGIGFAINDRLNRAQAIMK